MSQPGDEQLTCDDLKQKIAANTLAANEFLRQDKEVENGNIAKVVIGIPPELSNDEQIKARAIIDRNEWLIFVRSKKGCKE